MKAPLPSWQDYHDGTTTAFAQGVGHGYALGYHDAQEDARKAARGAQIARAGVDAIDTMTAREKADTYSTARGPVRGSVA